MMSVEKNQLEVAVNAFDDSKGGVKCFFIPYILFSVFNFFDIFFYFCFVKTYTNVFLNKTYANVFQKKRTRTNEEYDVMFCFYFMTVCLATSVVVYHEVNFQSILCQLLCMFSDYGVFYNS